MTICIRCGVVLDDDSDGPVIGAMCYEDVKTSDFIAVERWLRESKPPEDFSLGSIQ